VLDKLQTVQAEFNEAQSGDKRVSLADVIVLGGAAAIMFLTEFGHCLPRNQE